MLLNLATPSDGASVNPIPVALDCPTQWGPTGPVYTVTPTDGGSAYLASWTDQYSPMVTIDPALDATCLVLTEQALAAGPRWNLLGTTGGWLVFQWRWVMAAPATPRTRRACSSMRRGWRRVSCRCSAATR